MADEPFKVDDLNGLDFTDTLAKASAFGEFSLENININDVAFTSGNATIQNFDNPGEIHVLSDVYVPPVERFSAYTGSTYLTLPVFGRIQFEGVTTAQLIPPEENGGIIGGSVQVPVDFYINGFTENGLILSTNPTFTWRTPRSGIGGPQSGNELFVLAVNGFNTYGGVYTPATFTNDPSVFCFAEGTRIETASGAVAVEALAVGDMAVTASGEHRPVKWIGQIASRPSRHPRPWEVNPVRVKAHAFGPNRPERDVRLSPGHAVFVDGVLVPVGHLVNGATIVQEEVETIRYYHVELDSHDVLLAEGLPCESYLDDGNRPSFLNADAFTELHGRLDPRSWDDACAPLVAAGPQLVAIREQLHARAEALGWRKSEEAELAIEADGVRLEPLHREGNRYRFHLPAATTLTLLSGCGVLAHLMPALEDARRLGVAVAELAIDGERLGLDTAAFGKGFHGVERHADLAWRWTDGMAELRLDLAGPAVLDVTLAMVAPSWRHPAPRLRIAA